MVYRQVQSFTATVKNRKCGKVTSHCRKTLAYFLNAPVLRTQCGIYFNDIRKLSSKYNIYPCHTNYSDARKHFRPIWQLCSWCTMHKLSFYPAVSIPFLFTFSTVCLLICFLYILEYWGLVNYLRVLTCTCTLMSGEAVALNAHILLPELVKSVFDW